MIAVDCACGSTLRLADALVGKKLRCPDCGTVLVVEAPPPAEPKKKRRPARSSPVLLLHGPAIEEHLRERDEAAAAAERWQGPLRYALAGVAAFALAAGCYAWLSQFDPDSRLNGVLRVLCTTGGKWIIAGAFAVVGLLCWLVAVLVVCGVAVNPGDED